MAQVTFAPVKTTARNLGGTITYYIDGKLIAGVGAVIPLDSLDEYARGNLIVGGSLTWDALTIGANGTFLASDGTDAAWRVLAAADIQTISGITWTQAQTFGAAVTLQNDGLHLLDTNDSHDLIISPGSDLTADRTFTLTTGDAARTLSVLANVALNQDLQTTDSPTFADVTIADEGVVGLGAAKGRVEFHDEATDVLAVMDAHLGVGVDEPGGMLHVNSGSSWADSVLIERSGVSNNTMYAGMRLLATKTTDMGNNFGSAMSFAIQDDAGVVNSIALFGAVRANGDDETGALVFKTITAGGIAAERMRIQYDGGVGIGDISPSYKLDVNGSVNTTSIYRVDGTQVLTNRQTGWGSPTGTATRTTFATGTVTLPQLAERVHALIDDLTTHGLIGA